MWVTWTLKINEIDNHLRKITCLQCYWCIVTQTLIMFFYVINSTFTFLLDFFSITRNSFAQNETLKICPDKLYILEVVAVIWFLYYYIEFYTVKTLLNNYKRTIKNLKTMSTMKTKKGNMGKITRRGLVIFLFISFYLWY